MTRKFYSSVKKKDLYTMTDEDGHFLHHFFKNPLPEDSNISSSQSVALQLYQWCIKYGVTDTLKFIGGDSTNSNTGHKGGMFHFLENYLDRRLY